jgi:hypothetical protein
MEPDKLIRDYRETDLEEMVRIWYDASTIAHFFIASSFWALNKSAMREKYLPLAERENENALRFYKKCGFFAVGEEIDEFTGCTQILMCDNMYLRFLDVRDKAQFGLPFVLTFSARFDLFLPWTSTRHS